MYLQIAFKFFDHILLNKNSQQSDKQGENVLQEICNVKGLISDLNKNTENLQEEITRVSNGENSISIRMTTAHYQTNQSIRTLGTESIRGTPDQTTLEPEQLDNTKFKNLQTQFEKLFEVNTNMFQDLTEKNHKISELTKTIDNLKADLSSNQIALTINDKKIEDQSKNLKILEEKNLKPELEKLKERNLELVHDNISQTRELQDSITELDIKTSIITELKNELENREKEQECQKNFTEHLNDKVISHDTNNTIRNFNAFQEQADVINCENELLKKENEKLRIQSTEQLKSVKNMESKIVSMVGTLKQENLSLQVQNQDQTKKVRNMSKIDDKEFLTDSYYISDTI